MLVTGGAGFIGSHLVDLLVSEGHDVVVVDDFSTGRRENLEGAVASSSGSLEVVEADIRSADTVEVVARARPEVIHHLAAQADVRVSVEDPVRDAEVNLIGLLRVLEGAQAAGCRRIVFASSGGTIYGDPPPSLLPLDEEVPQRPVSPYGVSKKAGGDYLEVYRELHGIEYVALALANVYGPRQDPHGEAGVVAIFAGRLLAGDVCRVFGTGEQTRDFVHVSDVARAFALASERGSGLLNIGTGVETSVNTLYRTMAAAAGVDAEPVYAAARPGELERSCLDASRASAELGWKPEVSLTQGIASLLPPPTSHLPPPPLPNW